MALDIFKRIDTYKGLFAIEKISLIYNLLTSVLILVLYREMDHPGQMLWGRLQIAGMTFLLMYLYRLAPCKLACGSPNAFRRCGSVSRSIWVTFSTIP